MLSYKFKHICSRVIASLSAFGLISISDDIHAATINEGDNFTLSKPKAMTFGAEYTEEQCPTINSIIGEYGLLGPTGCVYTCPNNTAVTQNAAYTITSGETGRTGLMSTSQNGHVYFLNSIELNPNDVKSALERGSIPPLCEDINILTGITYKELSGIAQNAIPRIVEEVVDDVYVSTGDTPYGLKYISIHAEIDCAAGYSDSAGNVAPASGVAADGQYAVKNYITNPNSISGVYNIDFVNACHPLVYPLTFDCGEGTTRNTDTTETGDAVIVCPITGSNSCIAEREFLSSGKIHISCERDGYKFKAWSYSEN